MLADNPKIVESIDMSGWSLFDGEKMAPAKAMHRTVQYDVWEVKTESRLLECADFHFLFYEDGCRVLACELRKGDRILVDGGSEEVLSARKTERKEEMLDAEMDTADHRWSTSGIVSHNTTTCTAFLLHYALFNPEKKIAILANKGAQAREIMQRIELAYLHLPKWLQCGVKTWNKGSMELANGSSIVSATTSSDSIRGQSYSCVTGDAVVAVADENDSIWFKPIEALHSSEYAPSKDCSMDCSGKMHFYVCKIVNKINHKEYIGFHSTSDLNDGYMGSGKLILGDLEKYGQSAFEKTILKVFDSQKEAEDYERYLVDEEHASRPDTKNGRKRRGMKQSEEASRHMSEAQKDGLPESAPRRQKMLRVLTPSGFQSFDGTRIQKSKPVVLLSFSDGSELKCTADHKLKSSSGEFIEAGRLQAGDMLYSKPSCISVKSVSSLGNADVYDLLNVNNGNAYWTNNVVSHNCILIDECLAGKETVKVRRKSDGREMEVSLENFWKMV